ncbi:hypothetical protein Tco_1402340 [Tanacetum coccineum]
MVPRAVLMKADLVSVNTARQVNTAYSKTRVNDARPMSHLSKTTHSTVKTPIHKNTAFKNSNFNQRVNTVKDKNVNTVKPKAVVNVARPKAVVNVEIDDTDKDAEITLVHETQGRYGDEEMFNTCVLDGDEVLAEPEVTIKDEKANVVEDSSESITTTPTLTITTAAITITVVSTRPKAKGLVIHEEEQAPTPTVSSQQPSQVKAQDKGKGTMVEEHVKMKKKDQISLDEELAFKLQAEEEEEERLAREKAQREEEANIVAWDNVQAMIDADYQMAQ